MRHAAATHPLASLGLYSPVAGAKSGLMKTTVSCLAAVAAVLALAGCESLQGPLQEKGRAADSAVERGAKAAAAGVERGAQAVAKGVRTGVEAAARGVEKGAQAVARGADGVADSAGAGAPPKQSPNRWPPDRSGPAGPGT
jgi:hypothetical protein